MKRTVLFLVAVMALVACDRVSKFKSSHYIVEYRKVKKISPDLQMDYSNEGNITGFQVEVCMSSSERYSYNDLDKTMFNMLACKHNDLAYNGKICKTNGFLTGNFASSADIESIKIYCDSAWDANHEAGALLNDVINIWGFSCMNYIRNGYKGEVLERIEKPLNEMTKDDYELFVNADNTIVHFDFRSHPEPNVTMPLTVEMKFDDGATFSKEFGIAYNGEEYYNPTYLEKD